MDTIIVEIALPAVDQSYDFKLPVHIPVGAILPYLVNVIKSCTNNVLVDHENPYLCDLLTHRPIPLHQTLSQAGIRDGWKLMLL